MNYKIGQTVNWIGAGKVARLEGRNGKRNTGTVEEVTDNHLTVRVTHVAGQPFQSMLPTVLEKGQVLA